MSAKNTKQEIGAAFLEFALMFPVTILVLVGLVDFSRTLWISNVLIEASRHGARSAAAMGGLPNISANDELQQAVREYQALVNDSNDPTHIKEIRGPVACPPSAIINKFEKAAEQAACDYLQTSGLGQSDWKVTFSIENISGGFLSLGARNVYRVETKVEPIGGSQICLLCWFQSIREIVLTASSAMPLEVN